MKVIVTGAAGFIGSHLCEMLLEAGHVVTGIDNLAVGREANLRNFRDAENFTFKVIDITDKNALSGVFDSVDWVFHLAGLADIVPSIEMPEKYFQANVTGTLNVLELSAKCQVKKFLYAASSSSYGLATQVPTPETAPIDPQYPYALTKYMGEELVMHWHKVFQLPAISLRLFNVYGPRARTSGTYGAVFGVFLAQKLNGKPYTVVGDGNQSRDFTYVTDVANAFMSAAMSDITGEIMNVGSGNHYTVNKLVEYLEGDVEYIPKRPGEPDITFADTSKITRLLNWSPQVTFEQGVKNMLARINDWGNAPLWDKNNIADATKKWFTHLGK